MAVAECREIVGREAAEDKVKNKRYTRTFRVLCDLPTDGAGIVLAYPGLPQRGDVWQSLDADGIVTDVDLDAFCVDRRARSDNADWPGEWLVSCEYVGRGDPTLEPPRISVAGARYQVAVQKDAVDTPIVNSAGDPFEGGLTRDKTRPTITIVQNVLSFSVTDLELVDTLNSLPELSSVLFPGLAAGTGKIADVSAEAVWLEDLSAIHFWTRTVRIEVNSEGWLPTRVLDAGFNKLGTVLGVPARIPIVLPGGRPSSPVPLDGAGGVLTTGADPEYREFLMYPMADWTPLGLPL